MNPGKLLHRVTLQTPAELAADGYGETTHTWTDLAEVYAAIQQAQSGERGGPGQVVNEGTYRIAIRYRADVTTKMRVKYGARYFAIAAIVITAERAGGEMVLVCHEEIAA